MVGWAVVVVGWAMGLRSDPAVKCERPEQHGVLRWFWQVLSLTHSGPPLKHGGTGFVVPVVLPKTPVHASVQARTNTGRENNSESRIALAASDRVNKSS